MAQSAEPSKEEWGVGAYPHSPLVTSDAVICALDTLASWKQHKT